MHSGRQGASVELLQQVVEAARDSGQSTFGEVLERSRKADRIRSVSNLLKRFSNLFGMPARIRALAESGGRV